MITEHQYSQCSLWVLLEMLWLVPVLAEPRRVAVTAHAASSPPHALALQPSRSHRGMSQESPTALQCMFHQDRTLPNLPHLCTAPIRPSPPGRGGTLSGTSLWLLANPRPATTTQMLSPTPAPQPGHADCHREPSQALAAAHGQRGVPLQPR